MLDDTASWLLPARCLRCHSAIYFRHGAACLQLPPTLPLATAPPPTTIPQAQADDTANFLKRNGVRAVSYHAGKSNDERNIIQVHPEP